MADLVRRVEYYYATLPDAPGEGDRAMSALKEGGVNLLAMLAFPTGGGRSQLDLVPEDPDALVKAAGQAGIDLSGAKSAFLVHGEDRVGAVTGITAKLGTRRVSISPRSPGSLLAQVASVWSFGSLLGTTKGPLACSGSKPRNA